MSCSCAGQNGHWSSRARYKDHGVKEDQLGQHSREVTALPSPQLTLFNPWGIKGRTAWEEEQFTREGGGQGEQTLEPGCIIIVVVTIIIYCSDHCYAVTHCIVFWARGACQTLRGSGPCLHPCWLCL